MIGYFRIHERLGERRVLLLDPFSRGAYLMSAHPPGHAVSYMCKHFSWAFGYRCLSAAWRRHRPHTARTHMASALLSARDSLREYTSRAQSPSRVAFATRRANICQGRGKPPPVSGRELVCRASAQHASAGCVQSAGTAREPGAVEIGHFSAYSGLRHTGKKSFPFRQVPYSKITQYLW